MRGTELGSSFEPDSVWRVAAARNARSGAAEQPSAQLRAWRRAQDQDAGKASTVLLPPSMNQDLQH